MSTDENRREEMDDIARSYKFLKEILLEDDVNSVSMNLIKEYEEAINLKKPDECLMVIFTDVDEKGVYKGDSWLKVVSELSDILQVITITGCKRLWIHATTSMLYPKGVKPLVDLLGSYFEDLILLVPNVLAGGLGLALLTLALEIYTTKSSIFGPFLLETPSIRLYSDHVALGVFLKTLKMTFSNNHKALELWVNTILQSSEELEALLSILEALIISKLHDKAKEPISDVVARLLQIDEPLSFGLRGEELSKLLKNVNLVDVANKSLYYEMVKYNVLFKNIMNYSGEDVMICTSTICSFW